MKTKMTIKIKKRTQPGWLMWLLIMLPFFLATLNELLHLPWAIRYVLDVAWIFLLCLLTRFRRRLNLYEAKGISVWVILFLVYTLCVYLIQFQSPLYYLWGVRNNFRFYAAFFAFAAFLTPKDTEDYLKVFDKLFWLNVVVSLIQYFGMGLKGDYLGGIFGIEKGGNGYTNIFFVIVITKSILFYLEKRESSWSCISKCAAAILVAALAELKFFFIEFAVIIVLAVLFTNFTWRKLWVIVGGLAAVAVGAVLLTSLFPGFAGWFSVDWFWETASSDKGYTSSGDLNRLNAISSINELWLTNWGERLFGLGLGNCDTSTFAIVNTPFFEKYGDMHYSWISYAFMYLECGWIGLVFYFGFYVLVFFEVCRIEKHSEGIVATYCRISRIMAVCFMIITIYNSSLRTEAGYMAYFVLAIPFAFRRQNGTTDHQRQTAEGQKL